MKKITKIEIQQKNKDRVNIYLDGQYAFSCTQELLIQKKLKEGIVIEEKEIEEIIKAENLRKAFKTSLNYLTYRPRTTQETIDYLTKKGFDHSIIEQTISKLQYFKYLDDEQFIIDYLSKSFSEKKKSKEMIKRELIKKGIPLELIENELDHCEDNVDLITAKEISLAFFYKKADLPLNQVKNKLSQQLMRKGFSWEIINQCLSFLDNSSDIQKTSVAYYDKHYEKALSLAIKYYNRYIIKEKNQYMVKKKISYMLYQKGFDKDMITKVVDKVMEQNA